MFFQRYHPVPAISFLATVKLWLTICVLVPQMPLVSDEPPLDFSRDIRPILADKCFRCHGPDEDAREADLRLDRRKVATEFDPPAITPNSPGKSELVRRIESADEDMRMPPPDSGLVLNAAEVEKLKRWISEGAPYDTHWSFEMIGRSAIPVTGSPWSKNSIDEFILTRLTEAKMKPSEAADRRTMIRRLSLDLTGLPPSIDEVERFLGDPAPDAYEALVDRLLASPRFGERFGRHWLDQARYADTNGYTVDSERKIWPYRDWVIQAINDDMPFDRFTIEQLAGDLLKSPTQDQLVATGFHRNTLVNQEGGSDKEQFRVESAVDRVNTTGAVWLGLTVACAQCHSHKFDPLTQHEYYQLFAFFNQAQDANSVSPTLSVPTQSQQQSLDSLDAELAKARSELKTAQAKPVKKEAGCPSEKEPQDQVKLLQDRIKKIQADRKKVAGRIGSTMIMRDQSKARPNHVMIRGDFLRPGDKVVPSAPDFLPKLKSDQELPNRLDLARWLVQADQPLTPRVTVNRIWVKLFGRGLVETENDFGFQGTPPTHPGLLDYLAIDFVEYDWSLKHIVRRIVNSATYQQSSAFRRDLAKVDPRNLLWGRQARLRVEAEIVRDLALAASGLLEDRIGGPSVYPPQPKGVYAFTQRKAHWATSKGADRYRRGMYTFFMRSAPFPMLTTFDMPRMNTVCTRRVRSNTPLQALTMANSEAMVECARAFGKRLAAQAGDDKSKIVLAFELCLSRYPDPVEMKTMTVYLNELKRDFALNGSDAAALIGSKDPSAATESRAAWTLVARILLNLDEFMTRE